MSALQAPKLAVYNDPLIERPLIYIVYFIHLIKVVKKHNVYVYRFVESGQIDGVFLGEVIQLGRINTVYFIRFIDWVQICIVYICHFDEVG